MKKLFNFFFILILVYVFGIKTPTVSASTDLTVSVMDESTMKPVLFSNNLTGGNIVVVGEIQVEQSGAKITYDIYELTLSDYEVEVYFSDDGTPSMNSLIGTTSITELANGNLYFSLSTVSVVSGTVTARIENLNTTATSKLADPLSDATLTVNTTDDSASTLPTVPETEVETEADNQHNQISGLQTTVNSIKDQVRKPLMLVILGILLLFLIVFIVRRREES